MFVHSISIYKSPSVSFLLYEL